MGRIRRHSRIAAAIAATLVLASVQLSAVEAQAAEVKFNIESQPLAKALNSWAEQSGMQVIWPAGDPAAYANSAPVAGPLEPLEALHRLLENTGLTYSVMSGGRMVAIHGRGQQGRLRSGAHAVESEERRSGIQVTGMEKPLRRSAPTTQPFNAVSGESLVRGDAIPEEMVVTGTHIRGVVPQSSPLAIFSAQEIRNTGATTVEQFIQRLPQNHGGTFSRAPQSTGAFNPESASGIDLRGLGVGTTLVLINGRRMALAASGQTADISMIPLGAIDRVEVLTDGASGIYGADAVGGVVNLVLKREFEGAQTGLGYGSVTDGGLEEFRAEQTLGGIWGSGNGLVSYHFLDRNALDAAERGFSAAAAPYTLSPSDKRHSLLLSGTQRAPLGIELFGDALYSSRETASLSTHFAGASISATDADEKQFFADVGGRKALTSSHTAELVASYSTLTTQYDEEGSFLGTPLVQDAEFDHAVVDVTGKIDGDLFATPAGTTKFSAGGGYTAERYAQDASLDGVERAPLRLRRHTKYLFGEVFVPLVAPKNNVTLADRIELSVSARYTDYSDFGEETSPRVGLLWAPTSFLSLRATYSESFRAPSLVQLNPAGSENVIFEPAAFGFPDPFSADGTSMVLVPQGVGGAGLGPERARTYTAGFDLQPIEASELKFSATYFRIKYRDRILAPFVFTEPFADPAAYADVIYRNPDADLIRRVIDGSVNSFNMTGVDPTDPAALAGVVDVIVDRRTRNLALSDVDGVDAALSHRVEWSAAELSVGLQATYILDYDQQNTLNSPVISVYDTILRPVGLKGRAYVGLSKGNLSGQLNINYVDDYEDTYAASPVGVASWTTLDASVSYDFGDQRSAVLSGMRLALSVQNLFDKDPPFVAVAANGAGINDPVGFDPSNADPTGRFVAVQVSKAW